VRRGPWAAAVIASVLVGAMFLAFFPARTYLAQRRSLAAAQTRVAVLSKQNADLAAEAKKLHTDAEIERLAREQYNLVMPGEEAYAILPAPQPAHQHTIVTKPARTSRSLLARVWNDIQFWH